MPVVLGSSFIGVGFSLLPNEESGCKSRRVHGHGRRSLRKMLEWFHMPKLIIANWKENPRTEGEALRLFREVAKERSSKKVDVVVCPPLVYLERLSEVRRREKKLRVVLGAQDVFWKEKGPYTSEVGPKMLQSLGVQYVIVGHSERRKWLKETDAMINKKIRLALKDGLEIILCVGESLSVRRKGIAASRKFVADQLRKDLRGIGFSARKRVAVAYEPVWAIGTGHYDKPNDARAMAGFIKKRLPTKVLYGGSVDSKNIVNYVQWREIDGALVGGASLRAAEFKKIVAAIARIKNKK